MPHTITYAITYRESINSYNELPSDKRPPRNLWDKPQRLGDFLDDVFDRKNSTETKYVEYDLEEVE